MSKRYLTPSPDELKPYVLKGVWERYDEPPYQSLKWTLENFSALLVVACLTSLIALAQSQCWSLLRYIIAQYTKSPRLPGDSRPDPLLELSQGQAITSAIPVLSGWASILCDRIRRFCQAKSRHARDTRVLDYPVTSPYFGIASILNISFFLVMGVAIPWWLTEGVLGTPIVRSKITEECLKSNKSDHFVDGINRETRADEIFHLCRDKLDAGCDSAYHLSNPQITKARSMTCPFTGNICLNNTAPFEITHWNISAFELGVNSISNLLMSRRLTCAPVSLEPFLWKWGDKSFIYAPKIPPSREITVQFNVSLTLSTWNGPNKYSNEDSGFRMAEAEGPRDLTVLPNYVPDSIELNEFLQRDDGQSFLVVYRPGRKVFPNMIHDPFYAAHRESLSSIPGAPPIRLFYPDHEATALGCVEQFQYCFPPSTCTDWGPRDEPFSAMFNYLGAQFPGGFNGEISPAFENWNNQFAWSLKEMLASFKSVYMTFGVQRYLINRISHHKMLPLVNWGVMLDDYRLFDVDKEPWVVEVETWFMKAFLSGILSIQDGALYAVQDLDPGFSSEYIREWKLCGRILFHNEDFTNINWIGLWITILSLILICLVGNQVRTIHGVLKDPLKFLSRRMKMVISRLRKLPGTIRNLRRPAAWFSKPVTIWSVFSLFQSLSRRRPWYSSGSGLNENSDAAEMDDLEGSSTTPRQDNFGDIEDYEDIDNPI
jgi:hypothetical protein